MFQLSHVLIDLFSANFGVFIPAVCSDQNKIGMNCSIPASSCNLLDPCQNRGTCINNTESSFGYRCQCLHGFDGNNCQYDRRPCKPGVCWNSGKQSIYFSSYLSVYLLVGICNETSNTTFECHCQIGWTGKHCELMINYCENITCENNGVCQPLFMNYKCECIGDSYSGRHCEIVSTRTVVLRKISKSFAYVVIIFLVSVVAFFVIMDILKYGFGIDPAKEERERLRREKARKQMQRQRRPVIQRFTYVNERPTIATNRKRSAKIQETTV